MGTKLAIIIVILLGATQARAQICGEALALRVNQRGLDFVAKEVKGLVPTKLDVPAVNKMVMNWPLTESDAWVQVPSMSAAIKLKDLKLLMDQGALRIYGKADVKTGGPVQVLNPYAGLGSASCQADVDIKDLTIDVAVKVDLMGSNVDVQVTKALISLNNDTSVIALKGCALGKVVTSVVTFLRKHFMGTIQSRVEKIAKEKIPSLVESKLDETIKITREIQGFIITGRLDAVSTDLEGINVKLGAGVDLKHKTPPPCLSGIDLTPPAQCSGVQASLSSKVNSMFGVGVSEPILNQALHAAWRSGKLCISSDSLKNPVLTQGLDKLATGLGQPKGTRLAFDIRMLAPPVIRLTQVNGVELMLRRFMLKLNMTPPGGPNNQVVINTDLAIAATPWIDPAGNVVSLDLHRVALTSLNMQDRSGQASALQLDPARLHRFLNTVALPVLREKISSTPLSPSVINAMSYLVEMKNFSVGAGRLAAYLDVHKLDATGDTAPPQTTLIKSPGAVVGPQVLRILVSGSDDRTPSALLRYKVRVDGGKWSDPRYGGMVDVVTHGGAHLVEVAAIDHAGNVDPSPLKMSFKVDDVMPQLLITSRPDSYQGGDSAAVTFTGRDDRTAPDRLTYETQLYRVPDGGGMPRLVLAKNLKAGATAARFDNLTDGIYKVRIIVNDDVGNVTSRDVGFLISNDVGCSVTSTRPALPAASLLALLALCLLRRRRS